jgi:hypothetical protein
MNQAQNEAVQRQAADSILDRAGLVASDQTEIAKPAPPVAIQIVFLPPRVRDESDDLLPLEQPDKPIN